MPVPPKVPTLVINWYRIAIHRDDPASTVARIRRMAVFSIGRRHADATAQSLHDGPCRSGWPRDDGLMALSGRSPFSPHCMLE